MKIDIKSLLLGVLATALVLSLTSSKNPEEHDLEFSGYQYGFGVYNKTTSTFYLYKTGLYGNLQKKPAYTYKVAADGSGMTEKEQ